MWQCFSCKERFTSAKVQLSTCPVCGSDNIYWVKSMEVYGASSELFVDTQSDAMAIDSLLRCGADWPDIFSLVWGSDPAALNAFPKKFRMVVLDILLEMAKEEESDDYIDKKLHHIVVELLCLEYEKQVYDYIESEIKKMNVEMNIRRE